MVKIPLKLLTLHILEGLKNYKMILKIILKIKLLTTTPIRNALRDTAHSQTVSKHLTKK